MYIYVGKDRSDLGREAAKRTANALNEAIARQGWARIILSTGASQFETLEWLVKEDVAWGKVTMFHLDEYKDLPETHSASFRKYLKERFVAKIPLGQAHFVIGDGDVAENIRALTEKLREKPIDVALIGIGENGHIAFNDPPADFGNQNAYIVVNLDERCKRQQMGEGWFKTIDEVPNQAISMTVGEIMRSRVIISSVPGPQKAEAVLNTLARDVTNEVPATILKKHPDWSLFLDMDSSRLVREAIARK